MKSTLATLAVLAGVAKTSPIDTVRDSFQVSDFLAQAVPHSGMASYAFKLSLRANVIATECKAEPQTFNALVSINRTECEDDYKYSWSWSFGDGGNSTLQAWFDHPNGKILHGVHDIPSYQIVWMNQQSPTGTVQVYDGPEDFIIPYNSD